MNTCMKWEIRYWERCFEDEEELPSGIHKRKYQVSSMETINIVVVHVRMCKSVKAAKMMITYAACLWCMKV